MANLFLVSDLASDEPANHFNPTDYEDTVQLCLSLLASAHETGSWPANLQERLNAALATFHENRECMYAQDIATFGF